MKTYCQPVFVAPFGHVTSIYVVGFHVDFTIPPTDTMHVRISENTFLRCGLFDGKEPLFVERTIVIRPPL